MHPAEVEKAINLPNQMIGRNHRVEIKGIKELTLSVFPLPHHAPLPPMIDSSIKRNHGSASVSMGVLQHNPPNRRHESGHRLPSRLGRQPEVSLLFDALPTPGWTRVQMVTAPMNQCCSATPANPFFDSIGQKQTWRRRSRMHG